MPLSEHEQRLLEQMEKALSAEDPRFASTLRGSDLRGHYRKRMVLGALGVVVGLALLVVGVSRAGSTGVALGVAGFVVMLTGAFFAVTSRRRMPGAGDLGVVGAPGAPRGTRPTGKSGRKGSRSVPMMARLEERFRRRRDEGNLM